MPYDAHLAERLRELLAAEEGLSEMAMFGGLAFLLDGNMAVCASSDGGLMVRVGPDGMADAIARPDARPFEMNGRPMNGWVAVAADGLRTRRQLEPWTQRGVRFARSLPPKG